MHRVELKVLIQNPNTTSLKQALFLMHRVELKVKGFSPLSLTCSYVPNAPCGVESSLYRLLHQPLSQFLMHRVELKGMS